MLLVNRLQPLPFESLPSFLARLGQANAYPERQWYVDLVPSLHDRVLTTLTDQQALMALAELAGLPLERVVQMTLPDFMSTTHTSVVQVQHGGGGDVIGTSEWRGCVRCWQEDGAYLLPWYLTAVTSCPRHLVLLTNRCSACGSGLQMRLYQPICSTCRTPISEMTTETIAHHPPSVAVTQAVWNVLLGKAPHQEIYPIATDHPTNVITGAEFWSFLNMVVSRGATSFPRQSTLYDINPLVRDWAAHLGTAKVASSVRLVHGLVVTAWLLTVHWPTAWETLLQEATIEELFVNQQSGNVREPLFNAVTRRRWWHGPFIQWVQGHVGVLNEARPWLRVYRRLLSQPTERASPTRSAPWQVRQTYRVLQAQLDRAEMPPVPITDPNAPPHPTLLMAWEQRYLGKTPPSRRPVMPGRWVRLEAEAYTPRDPTELISRETVRTWWGVSDHHLTQLQAAGLLQEGAVWRVDELQATMERWFGHLGVQAWPLGASPLFWEDVLRIGRRWGLGLPALLVAVQSGELEAWRAAPQSAFTGIWTTPAALGHYGRKQQGMRQTGDRGR